ncbi:MAG: hypothetical protein [Bacteriophage sp.]|nr:MAG: hypothetical protein [Bacteriophage sp.]
MIEAISEYILGICIGCISYLIYEVFNLIGKIRRLIIKVNKLQNENIRFKRDVDVIIDNINFNKECIEHISNKISKINDNINDKFGFLD